MQTLKIVLMSAAVLAAPAAPLAGDLAKESNPPSIQDALIGDWEILPNARLETGGLVFKANGTYERSETPRGSTPHTVKGSYLLNEKQVPCAIDLCLGDCGGAASQWTTLFGIVRLLDSDKAEMYFPPDGKRPASFPESDCEGRYLLVRKEVN